MNRKIPPFPFFSLLLLTLIRVAVSAPTLTTSVIPTPKYVRVLAEGLRVQSQKGDRVWFFLHHDASAKQNLAAEWLREGFSELGMDSSLQEMAEVEESVSKGVRIYLIDWSRVSELKKKASRYLDSQDQEILADRLGSGQAYVLKAMPHERLLILAGSRPQGILYGAATLLDLLADPRQKGIIPSVHVRDYPDFKYRAAADWLLNAEINRWAYDWGDGRRSFLRRTKRKLDFCLRYKINMVFFDGFGWNSNKFPGYARMMRDLNGYARERGIKLVFGGYGANYQPALVQPQHNIGKIWHNRESYPDGEEYACFGEANPTYRMGRAVGGFLGTCRGNVELNKLKASELQEFVRSVEPGALYIHHEDVGNLLRMGDVTGSSNRLSEWTSRCFRCREKWPNDDFLARDGGAGAIAFGYTNLMKAVFSVRNSDTGYDASRDCTIIFLSPGYSPQPTDPQSWENHLTFWTNVVSLLPPHPNVEIGFREVFPHQQAGTRWMDAYRERLGGMGLNTRAFVFFLGGADLYSSRSFNYPFSATAALNGLFLGAETIYNFSGGLFQEPLQLINAQFSWNVKAAGHRTPGSYEAVHSSWRELMTNEEIPSEIIGPGGLLEKACEKLYGLQAGQLMQRYFQLYKLQPKIPPASASQMEEQLLVPLMPSRVYPLPVLWRALELDRDLAGLTPTGRTKEYFDQFDIGMEDWQQRWARLWQLYADVNREASELIGKVLRTPDLKPQARPDVEYLGKCLQVGGHFAGLLSSYHHLLERYLDEGEGSMKALSRDAQNRLRLLSEFLEGNFSFDTVGPLGGDQSSWLEGITFLNKQLGQLGSVSV